MEWGQFKSGLRWSAYSSTSSESNVPSIIIEDVLSSGDDQCAVNDNYLITFPDDDSDVDSTYDRRTAEEVDSENDLSNKVLNRVYENPLFIPASKVLKSEISDGKNTEQLMKREGKNFMEYKFSHSLRAVNDFDIEFESEETVPIVYLSNCQAARLQRSLRLGGYKKVRSFVLFIITLNN